MKKTLIGLVVLGVCCVTPMFAQGSFSDVPTDHWAYEAVNSLQQDGIIIGYPDGTFSGKRALTRFEFAAAIARMIPVLEERVLARVTSPELGGLASKEELNALSSRVTALENAPKGGDYVTQADFKALQQLVNEFRDELAGLGVDVDALKRDVAALAARVDAVEKEQRRVRWNGDLNVFGIATSQDTGAPIDIDGRPLQGPGTGTGELINAISFVRDMDLQLTAGLSPAFTAHADINFGNYLFGYHGGVITDYTGSNTVRPTSGTGDDFFPYYMYAEAGLGGGSVSVGRIPVQMTKYTLKMIDIDSYVYDSQLDSGNYPLDGGKFAWRMGGVDLSGWAAKTNQNDLLGIGLVSQPTVGLYDPADTGVLGTTVFHAAGGHGIGGLGSVDQAAGARLAFGTPFKGKLGINYIQAAGPIATTATQYDNAEIWGADANFMLGNFAMGAEYEQSTTTGDAGAADIDDNNTAQDYSVGFGLGKLGVGLGWKSVENNFGGAGYWDKLGMWTNPTNVEGWYADLNYGLGANLNLVGKGRFYSGANNITNPVIYMDDTDDDVWNAEIALKWGFASTNNVSLGWNRTEWSPSETGTDGDEDYITIGIAHQFNPSAGMSLSYQIIDTEVGTPYNNGAAYKGAVAVAQFQAKF